MLIEQLPQLIEWPQGSFTYLDRKMNLLYVRTTRDAYAEVLRLLEPIDQIPHQVLIKTLFVEVNLEDYETFGISANLMADDDERVQLSGALDFSPEQLPGLTTPTSGGTLSLAGVMTEPEFDLALDALQRTGTTRTLAAPNVICVNNCTARISVTQELIYVEDYEVDRADISGTTYGNPWNLINQQDPDAISNIGALSSEPIIIPVFAEGEDTGFTLDVAPSIGKDSRYITLMLRRSRLGSASSSSSPPPGSPPARTRPTSSSRRRRWSGRSSASARWRRSSRWLTGPLWCSAG